MNDYDGLPNQSQIETKSNNAIWIIGGGCLLIFLCFGCLTVFGLGVVGWQLYGDELIASADATEQAWDSRNSSYEATIIATSAPTDDNRNNALDIAPTETPVPADTAVPSNTVEPEPAPRGQFRY